MAEAGPKVREIAALRLTGHQVESVRGGYCFVDDVDGRLGFGLRSAVFYLDAEQERELRDVLNARAEREA